MKFFGNKKEIDREERTREVMRVLARKHPRLARIGPTFVPFGPPIPSPLESMAKRIVEADLEVE